MQPYLWRQLQPRGQDKGSQICCMLLPPCFCQTGWLSLVIINHLVCVDHVHTGVLFPMMVTTDQFEVDREI